MSYSARTIVFDIDDNYGDTNFMGIRSIELKNDGVLVTADNSNANYSGTSAYSTQYYPKYAYITGLSKIGTPSYMSWMPTGYAVTNQRIVMSFASSKTFDEVVVNNFHSYGVETDRGAKNIKVTISPDYLGYAVYNETVSNGTVIFDGQLDEHIGGSVADDQVIVAPALAVTTDAADDILTTSATLNGTLDSLGSYSEADVYFQLKICTTSEITAKSAIMDITDNYGGGSVGLRSVEFWSGGSMLALVAADMTCYASTTEEGVIVRVFDTSLSKTGSGVTNAWRSEDLSYFHQRIICVFDSDQTFDAIVINNYHNSGASTNYGAKNIKIITSTSTITDTTYGANILNSTVIWNNLLTEHTATDTEDDQDLTLSLSTTPSCTVIQETAHETKTGAGVFDAAVTGLISGVEYTVVAYAVAEGEVVHGDEETFTPGVVIVETDPATSVDAGIATLNGDLKSLSVSLDSPAELDVYFEYGPISQAGDFFGGRVQWRQAGAPQDVFPGKINSVSGQAQWSDSTTPSTKTATGTFSANVTGLDEDVEYQFRAVATNGTTKYYGEVLTFAAGFDIAVRTNMPEDIVYNQCDLSGYLRLGIASCKYYWQWGTTKALRNTTTEQTATTSGVVSKEITGLTELTTYFCRLVGKDDTASPVELYYGDILSFNTPAETSQVASHMNIAWLFEVVSLTDNSDVYYRWSMSDTYFSGNSYDERIIENSFNGVISKLDPGSHLISPSDLSYEIIYSDDINQFELESTATIIKQIIDGSQAKAWKFNNERVTFENGKIKFRCTSILESILRDTYPNTPNPQELWPSTDIGDPDYCIPVIFGTAYIPVMSVNTGADRYYVLGESGPTYTVDTVKSPHRSDTQQEFTSGSYTFTQSTDTDIRLCQFIISPDSPPENGLWKSGSAFFHPLCEFSKDETEDMDNPAEWLEFVLKDMGAQASDIDSGTGSSFLKATAVFNIRGLEWEGGYWTKADREKIISAILNQSDSFIYESDKIELYPFTRASKELIDRNHIVDASYRITPNMSEKSNSELFTYQFQADSQNAQKAAYLFFQKKYDIKNRIEFITSILALQTYKTLRPGNVITLYDPGYFNMAIGIIITSMHAMVNGKVKIKGIELHQMNEWDDLDPAAVAIKVDTTSGNMPD